MSFASDIEAASKKINKKFELVFRGTALDLFSKVILRTPVDTGRLRGNWQTTINKSADGVLSRTDKKGDATIGKAKTKANKAKLGESIYLTNNLPYAPAIENGASNQAPSGMVKVTVAGFEEAVSKKAREV